MNEAPRIQTLNRLKKASTVSVPLPQCPASGVLAPHVAREWNRFLWKPEAKTPNLLRSFIRRGGDATRDYTPKTLSTSLDRLEAWHKGGQELFRKSESSFMWKFRMLDREKRPKHWAKRSWTTQQAQTESKKNDVSIFRPEFDEQVILQGLWLVMATRLDAFIEKTIRFIVVDFNCEVGFSRGKPTSLALYDISCDSMFAHAYPITTREMGDYHILKAADFGLTREALLQIPSKSETVIEPIQRRCVYTLRLPTIKRDKFELVDCVDMANKHPETFEIPDEDLRSNLRRGDFIRLMINIHISRRRKTTERMWAIVDRFVGRHIVAVLDNSSEYSESHNLVKAGDEVAFLPQHVASIHPESMRDISPDALSAYFDTGNTVSLNQHAAS